MSHRKSVFDFAALEAKHTAILGSGPRFAVAVDEGFVTSLPHSGLALVGAIGGSQKAAVFVLAVDGADRAVLFRKGDSKELALGVFDEIAECNLHGLCWFILSYGGEISRFCGICQELCETFSEYKRLPHGAR